MGQNTVPYAYGPIYAYGAEQQYIYVYLAVFHNILTLITVFNIKALKNQGQLDHAGPLL